MVTLYYIHFRINPNDSPEIGATLAYTKTQLQHWQIAYQSAISGPQPEIYIPDIQLYNYIQIDKETILTIAIAWHIHIAATLARLQLQKVLVLVPGGAQRRGRSQCRDTSMSRRAIQIEHTFANQTLLDGQHTARYTALQNCIHYTTNMLHTCRFIFGLESKTHTRASSVTNFSRFSSVFFASFFNFQLFFISFESGLFFKLEGNLLLLVLLACVLNRLVRRLGLHLRRK